MLKVQTRSGTVEIDRKNGKSQSKYQGYTTGAQKRDAAIGQAKASKESSTDFLLIQIAARNPTSTASPARSCGAATRSSVAKTGSLKRNRWTYVASEPMGIRPWLRKGTYRSPKTVAASAASRTRTRFQ